MENGNDGGSGISSEIGIGSSGTGYGSIGNGPGDGRCIVNNEDGIGSGEGRVDCIVVAR